MQVEMRSGMFVLVALLAYTTVVNGDSCYANMYQACKHVGGSTTDCSADYSGVYRVIPDLQKYTATHIDQNFQYLLMSVYFNNYQANRPGLSKLYRKLSDDAWEDTLDLVKYMAKRGFNMNYDISSKKKVKLLNYEMNERTSLAAALEMQKILAEEAHHIHSESGVRNHKDASNNAEKVPADDETSVRYNKNSLLHDAETMNFLEKEFVAKHSDTIRALSGYTIDLHNLMVANTDPSLAIYLFDEYLQKVVG